MSKNIDDQFIKFEKELVNKLLQGEDKVLSVLRKQYEMASVKSREFTGVGFFTNFLIDPEAPVLNPPISFQFGDVAADFEGLENGVGFVLFIKNGLISLLEGYCFDENFPKDITSYKLYYDSKERNLDQLRNAWLEKM